jgi:hypothetical protein
MGCQVGLHYESSSTSQDFEQIVGLQYDSSNTAATVTNDTTIEIRFTLAKWLSGKVTSVM